MQDSGFPGDICATAGCGKRLRKDNRIGYCWNHRTAKAREPARFCAAPGCDGRLRADNTTGYCKDHREPTWKTVEYRAMRRALYHARPKPPARFCAADGCGRKIRPDNATGRCQDHRYVPLNLPVCSVDRCGKRLNSGNTLGRCTDHRDTRWADDAPKCGSCPPGTQSVLREYSQQHRASTSTWNAANPEARQAANARRRSRAAVGMDETDRLLSTSYRIAIRNDPCRYCGSPVTDHVDHFFPLAKGGSDKFFNLVRACTRDNLSKGTMCGTRYLLLTGG